MTFADSVKEYRKQRGLSQVGLAQEIGVDQATISRIERGGPVKKPVELLLQRMMSEVASAN